MNLEERINKLVSEIEKNQKELNALELLKVQFPDLKINVDRWNKQKYYSALANELAQNMEMIHNCGCCVDSTLELWPYFKYEGVKIYSDPPKFIIGENSYSGDKPHSGWEDKLRKAKIKESLIKEIQTYFEETSSDNEK